MNENVAIHQLSDPSTAWVFRDPFIAQAVIRQASRLLVSAAAERPEFTETAADPDLACEAVAPADVAVRRSHRSIHRCLRELYADTAALPSEPRSTAVPA